MMMTGPVCLPSLATRRTACGVEMVWVSNSPSSETHTYNFPAAGPNVVKLHGWWKCTRFMI